MLFRAREEGRETEASIGGHMCSLTGEWTHNLRYVPWPGIELKTFQTAVTSCKDVTKVMFSSVTYVRKLPLCYCLHTDTACGSDEQMEIKEWDFVTHLQNDIWNTCVQCSWEELSVLYIMGLIHNCENIFWKMMQKLSQ